MSPSLQCTGVHTLTQLHTHPPTPTHPPTILILSTYTGHGEGEFVKLAVTYSCNADRDSCPVEKQSISNDDWYPGGDREELPTHKLCSPVIMCDFFRWSYYVIRKEGTPAVVELEHKDTCLSLLTCQGADNQSL